MSCWTGYVVVDGDGQGWHLGTKWGAWLLDEPERSGLIDRVHEAGVPLDRATEGAFGDWYCHGVALDVPARRYGFFHQHADTAPEPVLEDLRSAPLWSGWDVRYCHGGREDISELIPAASAIVQPYEIAVPALRQPIIDGRENWFLGWDPQRLEITVRDDPASIDWYHDGADLVTIITDDLIVRDHAIEPLCHGAVDDLVAWLSHGPAIVETLSTEPPCPLLGNPRGGAVIDLDRRVLSYWTRRTVPRRLLAGVQAAWPGWSLRRLPANVAAHRAASGRGDGDPRPLRVSRIVVG